MESKYTTIGQVRELVVSHHQKSGRRCPFRTILEEIQNCDLSEVKFGHDLKCKVTLFPIEVFAKMIDQMPIEINHILSNPSKFNINEMFSIPQGRDVAGFVHLPYINDQMHFHDHFEINYVYRGRVRQRISNEERFLEEGELCIIAPHMEHNVLVDDEETFVISLMVRKSTFESIFGNLMIENDLLATFFRNTLYQDTQVRYLLFKADRENEWIKKLIQDIMIEANGSKRYANAYVNCLLHQLFYMLLREYSDTILYYGQDKLVSKQSSFAMILAYVQNNYNVVTLSSVAKYFNYSERYLSKLFSQNMHTTLNKILQNIKMQKAREYLSGTNMSVAEISQTIGYESVDYFTRIFKKHYGCTPSKYRKVFEKQDPDV